MSKEQYIPRRNRIDLNTKAELAIREAVNQVELLGADVKLTDAVNLLSQARELIADYVDTEASPTLGELLMDGLGSLKTVTLPHDVLLAVKKDVFWPNSIPIMILISILIELKIDFETVKLAILKTVVNLPRPDSGMEMQWQNDEAVEKYINHLQKLMKS